MPKFNAGADALSQSKQIIRPYDFRMQFKPFSSIYNHLRNKLLYVWVNFCTLMRRQTLICNP